MFYIVILDIIHVGCLSAFVLSEAPKFQSSTVGELSVLDRDLVASVTPTFQSHTLGQLPANNRDLVASVTPTFQSPTVRELPANNRDVVASVSAAFQSSTVRELPTNDGELVASANATFQSPTIRELPANNRDLVSATFQSSTVGELPANDGKLVASVTATFQSHTVRELPVNDRELVASVTQTFQSPTVRELPANDGELVTSVTATFQSTTVRELPTNDRELVASVTPTFQSSTVRELQAHDGELVASVTATFQSVTIGKLPAYDRELVASVTPTFQFAAVGELQANLAPTLQSTTVVELPANDREHVASVATTFQSVTIGKLPVHDRVASVTPTFQSVAIGELPANEGELEPSVTITSDATIIGELPSMGLEITAKSCIFDLCEISHVVLYCHNNGVCKTNQVTCMTECACAEGYSGNKCQYENDTVVEKRGHVRFILRSNIANCSESTCKHGICVSLSPHSSRCKCNKGWFGTMCSTFGSTFDLQSIIDNSPGHIPRINMPDSTLQQHSIHAENYSTNTVALHDQNYNICTENPLRRSEEETVCDSRRDLSCQYGVCEQTLVDHGSWKGYTTVCNCDVGARGTFCEYTCCLGCGEHGKCDVHVDGDNSSQHCNCKQRYTGKFCEIFVPGPVSIQIQESTWYLWIVGVCLGTFLILITLAVLGPYFMWKHRVIIVMKIVHYFQAYEDDDDKEWDAFISYKSHPADEHFVVHVLYPKLEKELGFKLCMHFRDFVPGETISNNIINAVEGSRRTILILTPRYVESEFTRFEYQKAQTEMLKRRHRIIPVLLEDISGVSDMDKNLKDIINSVTYLEWPRNGENANKLDSFWKRLQLSLPKKKICDFESDLESRMNSTQSTCTSGVSSVTSYSENVVVSNEKEKWIENAKISSHRTDTAISKPLCEYYDESIYAEIGTIDETLTDMVKPLSEKEELQLVTDSRNSQILDYDTSSNAVIGDYVDMEHDRYIEFKIEDNPPSASLTRKNLMTSPSKPFLGIIIKTDDYIEVNV